MKILLVAEGASELEGALLSLVVRLGLEGHEIEQDRVSQRTIHAHHGKGKGYFKRAVRWMLEADRAGYDAIILVIDQDDQPQRSRELEQAQDFGECQIRRAFGVAIRSFDAWILADESALTAVLECTVSRQSDPEKHTDPKSVCRALFEDSDSQLRPAEMYAAVAAAADLAVLETRCAKGFAPFADRVRELAD